eukprot:Skav221382  [mRNA]  locus=scaffold7016:18304:23637:- [translate_table: standard]
MKVIDYKVARVCQFATEEEVSIHDEPNVPSGSTPSGSGEPSDNLRSTPSGSGEPKEDETPKATGKTPPTSKDPEEPPQTPIDAEEVVKAKRELSPDQRVGQLTARKLRQLTQSTINYVKNVDKMLQQAKDVSGSKKIVIWEVFAGKGNVTMKLQQKYPYVEAQRFSLTDGWDFKRADHRRQFLKKLREEEPDSVWLSPMCRLWSPLQELTVAACPEYAEQLQMMRQEDHDTILTFVAIVFEEQRRKGRDATVEHPWPSRAWNTKAFQRMKGIDAYVDQYQYGLALPDEVGVLRPVKKPTCFRTTGTIIHDMLSACCDQSHLHTRLEGNVPGAGPRSKLAENYPLALASRLAAAMVKQARQSGDLRVLAAEDDDEALNEMLAPIEGVEEETQEAARPPSPQEAARPPDVPPPPDGQDPIAINRDLRRQVGSRAVDYVQRLHKNLGHVSSETLQKMLTEVQATEDVMLAAKHYVCPTCYARKRPAQAPPSSGLKTTEFNDRIQVDSHWIRCTDSMIKEKPAAPGTPAARKRAREITGRQCVLTIVDHATRYCAVRILKAESADEFTKGVERCWFKHFGLPKYLRIDEAKGWSSKHVREWASSRGIILEIQPAEQHSWLGVVERKHQVIRRALELYQDDYGEHSLAALKEAATYVPHAINQTTFVKGFTPQQWVLGKSMTHVHGLTSEIFNPGQEPIDEADAFSKIQKKRSQAQMAWIKADTDAKLRRAFNQKFVDIKDEVVVGQKVWYWRVAGTGILQKAKWRGPARVVAIEEHSSARVIWLCHGTSLVRCAERQVRPLVEEVGIRVPPDRKAAVKDLEMLKARSTTQFKDEIAAEDPHLEINDEDDLADYAPESPLPEEDQPQDEEEDTQMDVLPEVVRAMMPRGTAPEDRERTPRRHVRGESGVTTIATEPDAESLLPAASTARSLQTTFPSARRRSPKRKQDEENVEAEKKPKADPPTTAASAAPVLPEPLASEVPVPESADDELYVDAHIANLSKQVPSGWCCVDGAIEMEDAFYTQMRKGEVNTRKLTLLEQEEFIEAKRQELEQFFCNDVWEFENEGQKHEASGRTITARWVLTWKKVEKEGEPTRWKAKARLVLRGFQDPDLLNLKKAAPTASRLSRSFLLAAKVWCHWDMHSGDVKCAFLSGSGFERVIIVRLPNDCGPLLGVGHGPCHMKLKKSAYGLSDAPLLWYQEADRRLTSMRWFRHPLDQCCYLLTEDDGVGSTLVAMLILHVDDILVTGSPTSPTFAKTLKTLKKSFNFGKWDTLSPSAPIKYCGSVIMEKDDGSVEVSFEEYVSKICPISVNKDRDMTKPLTNHEITKARALIGALQWPATQGFPALSASVSIQAGELSGATGTFLLDLNKTLRFAKQNAKYGMKFMAMSEKPKNAKETSLKDMVVILYADAAFDVRKDHSSQGGYVVLVADKAVLTGVKCPTSTISWRSFKLPRVCRSSLGAECQSLSASLEEMMIVKSFLMKLQSPSLKLSFIKENVKQECATITDCKALYDCIQRETIAQAADKRVAIEGLVIKDLLRDLNSQWRWISSERQLADGLTKVSARQQFVDRSRGGYIQLVADETYTAAKKKTRAQRQETIQETRMTNSNVAQALIALVMASSPSGAAGAVVSEDALSYTNMATMTTLVIGLMTFAWILRMIFQPKINWKTEARQLEKENDELRDELTDAKGELRKVKTQKTQLLEELERKAREYEALEVTIMGSPPSAAGSSTMMTGQRGNIHVTEHGAKWHSDARCRGLNFRPTKAYEPCRICANSPFSPM